MGYISTKEIAKQWGISISRVVLLASRGRIPGAILVGKSWMFPPNTKKPLDMRTKNAKKHVEEVHFRFPIYCYMQYQEQEIANDFTEEERALYQAQRDYYHCEHQKAYDALKDLLENAEDRVVKIGCLYYLCLVSMPLRKYSEFYAYLKQIRDELSAPIPHKKELEVLIGDLESYCIGSHYYLHEFSIDSTYDYHPSAKNYLLNSALYSAMLRAVTQSGSVDATPYRMIVHMLDDEGVPGAMVCAHMYLSVIEHTQNLQEACKLHLRKAIELAQRHDLYTLISYFYHYVPDLMEQVLAMPEYEAAAAALRATCKDFYECFQGLLEYDGKYSSLRKLSKRDFEYIRYAAQGLTSQ